ncbi:MAG: FAD-dependent oxidoreductase [Candidatus Cloacimonetes bacterium]|jgi:NADPH-dependent 2,4-dienoyl-CoA reductase/sulfur reductase-like enzyme/Fe-S-cluster-containing hydrogenase component 2/bacterioferritin-associated ferredoxin|nr:FAD-dependent oxidoreductase [Candidatus Cloacimonadota bacterium]
MKQFRIAAHPILNVPMLDKVSFYFNGKLIEAQKGEMISSALIANGIDVFGHHHKDDSAQGMFCANGQCAKCTVIANGVAVKSCMTAVEENMIVQSAEGLPVLPEDDSTQSFEPIEDISCEVLIIGGGPAGLSAAAELGKHDVDTILLDDKKTLGGKLVLQTHKFFGSQEDSRAGTRGHNIGQIISEELDKYKSVQAWKNSTALFVFSDKKVGVLKDGVYKLITPKRILNAAGAREKFLRFQGNNLARIYGAGAFQTLVNRDLVRPTQRLFIIGGGNVGLIAAYHAMQAGIEVVGLAEAMPHCGGYKVHEDKLRRFGVPIYTSHSILCAYGEESVEGVTITAVDEKFNAIEGTEKSFACDTVLVAVGLDSLSEFTLEAEQAGIPIDAAGDALEIAEASSAMFNGKIAGLKIAKIFKGDKVEDIPESWYSKAEMLKRHPGQIKGYQTLTDESGVMPIIHCLQEIPCNPCTTVCPTQSIHTEDGTLFTQPQYDGKCIGCGKCLLICPGLAITLVDYRKNADLPTVSIAYEIANYEIKPGDKRELCDIDANFLGVFEVVKTDNFRNVNTMIVRFEVPREIAKKVAGFRVQAEEVSRPLPQPVIPERMKDEAMVCLCERVTAGEVRALIRQGIHDLNQIKAMTRAGMGPCGAKTCEVLIKGLLREEGVAPNEVISNTKRPVFVEVPLGVFPGGGVK